MPNMQTIWAENRARLRAALPGQLIILAAHRSLQRAGDMAATFYQEPNFYYLTGLTEPDWLVVIDDQAGKEYLIAPQRDAVHQLFDGQLSAAQASHSSGIPAVLSLGEGQALLDTLARRSQPVYTLGPDPRAKRYDFVLNPGPQQLRRRLKKQFGQVQDCRLELARLRAIKQPHELKAIKQAIAVTLEGFQLVRDRLAGYSHEYQIEADFTYHFTSHNLRHAYDPIIAADGNACTLHYSDNSARVGRDQLLLMDVGASVDGYAADITRTFAVGPPGERARQVHKAVQTAHHDIIKLLKPGLNVQDYQQQSDAIMQRELSRLGLLNTQADYRRYFPHAISHGLGLDVHDSLGGPTEFQPGMVLTVEPGIYLPAEKIGVRIEDDILITTTGHDNLSAALPTSL